MQDPQGKPKQLVWHRVEPIAKPVRQTVVVGADLGDIGHCGLPQHEAGHSASNPSQTSDQGRPASMQTLGLSKRFGQQTLLLVGRLGYRLAEAAPNRLLEHLGAGPVRVLPRPLDHVEQSLRQRDRDPPNGHDASFRRRDASCRCGLAVEPRLNAAPRKRGTRRLPETAAEARPIAGSGRDRCRHRTAPGNTMPIVSLPQNAERWFGQRAGRRPHLWWCGPLARGPARAAQR